jgi:hypothetical protein
MVMGTTVMEIKNLAVKYPLNLTVMNLQMDSHLTVEINNNIPVTNQVMELPLDLLN